MKEKDKLILLEFICAFALVAFSLALFGGVMAGYNIFILAGLLGGFAFSWLNRDTPGPLPKVLVTCGTVAIFGWMAYSVINSSLFYKEVILLCIKAALLLEAVLSFNAATPSLLAQMEALSIPICMGFPIFTTVPGGQSALFALGYFLSWVILLRVKFYSAFTQQGQAYLLKNRANLFIFAFVILTGLAAAALYYSIPLAALKASGIFRDKGKTGIDIGPDELEKEYYRLQEKLNKWLVNRHIPGLSTSEERHDALKYMESLIRELPDAFEVDRAEQGLVTQLKIPGPGAEKEETEEVTFLKNYVEKKCQLNIERLKENVLDVFKSNPLDIKSRLRALEKANKLQAASVYERMRKINEQLNKTVEDSSLDKNMKGQARALSRQLRSWKGFELFRREKEELKKKAALPENRKARDMVLKLIAAIERAKKPAEFKEIKDQINTLKQEAVPESKAIADKLEEILYAKLEMLLAEVSSQIKKAAEEAGLAGERLLSFQENIDTVVGAQSPQELRQGYEQAQGAARAEKIKVSLENKELAGLKDALLVKDKQEKISDALQANTPRELREKLAQELEIIEGQREEAQVKASFTSQNEYIDQFFNLGFVSAKEYKALKEAMRQLEELLIFNLQLEKETPPEEKKMQQEIPKEEIPKPEEKQPEEQVRKERKLLLVKVLPVWLKLALGQGHQFVALGTYSDNTQEDLTNRCDWSSSNLKVASILAGKISTLSVGIASINAKYQEMISEPAMVVVEEAQLTAIVIPFKEIKVALWGKFALKADGYYTDLSRRDLTALVDWEMLPTRIFKIEGARLNGLKLGKGQISASYQGIESPAVEARVVLTFGVLLLIIFWSFFYLILAVTCLFLIFFVLTWEKKRRMLELYRSDPRRFIFLLYCNAVEVLALFEPKRKGYFPPLSLAREIEAKFGIKDNVFIRFSAKYSEAKYSRHAIGIEEAKLALSDYNNLLRQAFKSNSFLKLALKRALALLLRKPFFIP